MDADFLDACLAGDEGGVRANMPKDVANVRDESGASAFHLACRAGSTDVLEFLFKSMRSASERTAAAYLRDSAGNAPFHEAASSSETSKLVDILIKYANAYAADVQNDKKETPLHAAVRASNSAANCDALIERALADIAAKDDEGYTALARAKESAPKCVDSLEKAAKPAALTKRLCLAAQLGFVQAALALVKAGAPKSAHDANGWTPLHYAAATGDKDMVKALLRAGCDAAVKSNDDKAQTPAALAEEEENEDVAEMLSAASVPPSERLRSACESGDAEAVEASLEAGADVNAADGEGWTALHFAASEGHASIVKTLVDRGADVSKQNEDGETPKMLAEELDDETIVQEIMSALNV